MNRVIGGYFSLETAIKNQDCHLQGIYLNSGRNALEYILRSIPIIHRIWIPYYTCEVVLEPIKKLEIPYSFYCINKQLELANEIQLESDEYLLVTNYFGIKDAYIKKLASIYGKYLIVDNAQALFAEPIEGIKTFYSPRKFVGIPDGGIAYIDKGLDMSMMEEDISYNRCSHLLKRIDLGAEAGYEDFRENSSKLARQSIKRMSNLTLSLFQSIELEAIKQRRCENFKYIHDAVSGRNLLSIPHLETFACPMIYPLYSANENLKKRLIENKIFVATYWPNLFVWCNEYMIEYELAQNLIAIPIDQRYNSNDMDYIIKMLMKYGD